MRPAGKWIADLHPQTTVADAARLALTDRLSPIPRLLTRAAAAKPDSPDAPQRIHQLRVATRRAAAAIGVFADVLPAKHARRVKRWLRDIRRAAGSIRDQQLLAARFRDEAKARRPGEAPAARTLAGAADTAALAAWPTLAALARKHGPDRLARASTKLIGAIDPAAVAESSVAAFARRVLRRELDDVRAAAAADLTDVENVHQLRIAFKQLRYGMELFGASFDDTFRRALYADLHRIQERLGDFNDLATLAQHTAAAANAATKPTVGLARLARRYADQLSAAHTAFLDQWTDFGFDHFCQRFEAALSPRPTAPVMVEPKATAAAGRQRARTTAPALNGHAPHIPDRQRIAAIDVGTNSLRLIIAETSPDGSYRVLDDEKEVTRLGRGLNQTGRLDPDAIEHSVAAIARMQSIAQGYGASRIRVVGTAAAREAANGQDLARILAERTGLTLEIISAEQEAMLAHRSASRAFDLRSLTAAVIDVGGGSTEIVLSVSSTHTPAPRTGAGIVAAPALIDRIYTIPLGAVRLTERFGGPEPCAGERYEEMKRFVRRVVKQHIGRATAVPQLLIGTGGTITTLGAMALQRDLGVAGSALFAGLIQGHEVPRSDPRHLLEYLRKLPVKDRARVPGLSADRADIIVAGLVIVDAILKRLDGNRIRIHEGGIRDGLLLSMIAPDGRTHPADASDDQADPIASAKRFARACAYEEPHSLHVANLALQIFDQLGPEIRRALGDGDFDADRARRILEAAAILHDVGYLINYASHHKHSYHLIVHADLPGWTSRDVQIVANIARYHRCAEPKRKHRAFSTLAAPDQQLVRVLAGILRIADGLDRTHIQRITHIALRIARNNAHFDITAADEPGVDLWGAARKGRLFEEALGLTPNFEWRAPRDRLDEPKVRPLKRGKMAAPRP